ncbi:galactose oxidase early set domain-containing protein, partial [Streptomyces sp. NPDC006368]|uniref:galactose oxidase early set domain-containing protein n=1 Tax=Streptomyces sp. NPDC006368 TaxID=3156760 RepID=UPI00339E135B
PPQPPPTPGGPPGRWNYGDTQRITVDRPIAKAELIRPAAVTHSSDPNQRFVDLPLSVIDDRTVDLNVTGNPNLAPPGWYMLFAVDANGVPSIARWVHLGGPAAMAAEAETSAHVHDFAGSLAAEPRKPLKKRSSAPVSPRIAGCDRHYGTAGVCVPTAFPRSVKATTKARCDWLATHDYGHLKVNGKDDPLRLDPNRDGLACGKGDTPTGKARP